MLTGKAYLEGHNQVAGIIHRNISAEYGLEVPGSRWETPSKMIENERVKILSDILVFACNTYLLLYSTVLHINNNETRATVELRSNLLNQSYSGHHGRGN